MKIYHTADVIRVHGFSSRMINYSVNIGIIVPSIYMTNTSGRSHIWNEEDMLILGVVRRLSGVITRGSVMGDIVRALRGMPLRGYLVEGMEGWERVDSLDDLQLPVVSMVLNVGRVVERVRGRL